MNTKCNNCGTVYNSNFCPNCGTPASTSPAPKKKGMSAGAIVALALLGILAFVILMGMIGSRFFNSADSVSGGNTSFNITDIQKVAGISEEQEAAIVEILNNCGIEIKTIVHDELLDDVNKDNETGYRVSTGDVNNIILYLNPDKTVNIIRYADNDLFEDGKTISSINDYIVTWDEASDLQISCQNAIKSILKSPSTAKFPNLTEWGFSKQDGEIIVQGYVDSQNSFGAELRSEFQFILSVDNKTVKSLIFDDEEMISK